MNAFTGSRNTAGFSATIASSTNITSHPTYKMNASTLPPPTHLSYEGLFNELRFNVGPKTDKDIDIHHGYARFQFS